MLRGSYSLDGRRARPCCPCSPSAILFFPTSHAQRPRPRRLPVPVPSPHQVKPVRITVPCVGVQTGAQEKTSRKAHAQTTLTHVPLLSSARTLLPSPLFLP